MALQQTLHKTVMDHPRERKCIFVVFTRHSAIDGAAKSETFAAQGT